MNEESLRILIREKLASALLPGHDGTKILALRLVLRLRPLVNHLHSPFSAFRPSTPCQLPGALEGVPFAADLGRESRRYSGFHRQ